MTSSYEAPALEAERPPMEDPPTLEVERRYTTRGAALQALSLPVGRRLVGYAALFDVVSEDLGGFREVIRRGAFARAIAGDADIRALFNHDRNHVLGRTSAETLLLQEDDVGLKAEIVLPETQFAADLAKLVGRGDVSQMSFSFVIASPRQKWERRPDGWLHIIERVDKLLDVSVVTVPAYPQTRVTLRSLRELQAREEAAPQAEARLRRLRLLARAL